MKPTSPVVSEEHAHREVVFAKNQSEYTPLPAYPARDPQGHVLTRWALSWSERFAVFFGGSVWLTVLTFDQQTNTKKPLQPVMIDARCPVQHITDSVFFGQVTEWSDMRELREK